MYRPWLSSLWMIHSAFEMDIIFQILYCFYKGDSACHRVSAIFYLSSYPQKEFIFSLVVRWASFADRWCNWVLKEIPGLACPLPSSWVCVVIRPDTLPLTLSGELSSRGCSLKTNLEMLLLLHSFPSSLPEAGRAEIDLLNPAS